MAMTGMILRFTAAATAVFAIIGCGAGDDPAATEKAAPAELDDPYPYEPVNVDLWLERLEVGSRELFSARNSVANALEFPENTRIADVGAGTGLYSLLFAEKVGEQGVVYAVDIAPRFLTLINQRAEDLGFDNIVSVLGRPDSITLPPASVDAVFIADTYHYFEDPASIMKTVFDALKPGGHLYIVDYRLVEGQTPPADKRHVRFGMNSLVSEIESFGFVDAEEIRVAGLAKNYMVRFTRP